MDTHNEEDQLMVRIQKSFFLLESLDNLLVDLICVNKDFNQQKLLLSTIHHEIIKKFPNKLDYTVRYLKQLISLLEYNGIEVLETIYTEYVTFLRTKAEDKEYYYRHFMVDEKTCVIRNTYSMISRGTTGLCVWEGAMVLAEWCLQNKNMLEDKIVLELGCGVGMAGLVAIENCKVGSYIFTDCNDEVLKILKHNVQINIEKCNENAFDLDSDIRGTDDVSDVLCDLISKVSEVNITSDNGPVESILETVGSIGFTVNPSKEEQLKDTIVFQNPSISIRKLSFEELSHLKPDEIVCDIVLASDIVYDSDLFPSLKNALVNIFNHNKSCTAIFACKVRNMDTFESFVKILKGTNLFQVSEEKLRSQNLLFFSDHKMYSMVKILIIKRNNSL